jgi:Nucleotidyl transferase
MASPLIIPVILAGGTGTRLWPISRYTMPKQFLPLMGDRSTFQQALARVSNKSLFAPPIVMTSDAFRFFARRQAQEIGLDPTVVLEPFAPRFGGGDRGGSDDRAWARSCGDRAHARRRSRHFRSGPVVRCGLAGRTVVPPPSRSAMPNCRTPQCPVTDLTGCCAPDLLGRGRGAMLVRRRSMSPEYRAGRLAAFRFLPP